MGSGEHKTCSRSKKVQDRTKVCYCRCSAAEQSASWHCFVWHTSSFPSRTT